MVITKHLQQLQQLQHLQSARWGDALAVLAGCVLPLAFAPVNFHLIAVIAPALLLSVWLTATPKRALWRGWLFGLGLFGVGVSWIYVSIHQFGNAAAPLAAFITALFVMILALFPALQGYLLTKYFPKNTTTKLVLAFPLTWVLLEWIRSWLLTGFPWLLIGYSQVGSPLQGYIPLIGVYGIGFILTVASGLIVNCFYNAKPRKSAILTGLSSAVLLTLIWYGGFYLSSIQWTKPLGKPVRVAIVQGNIPQNLKWNPNQLLTTLKIYYDLTAQHWDNDIIVWPEAAIPIPMNDAKEFLKELDLKAKTHHVSLITGIPVAVPDNSFYFYNAIIALGEGSGHYYKRHLVPFGEYVPFGGLLRGIIGMLNIPMSDMVSGPADQPDLLAGKLKLAPFICYETAYASDLKRELPQGNLLVTISDDAWFGDSLAPFQHLQMGQFRAIQGGRDMIFSGNNGITALINAKGVVVKRAPQFERTVLTGTVQPMTGSTPWIRYGNLPIIVLFWLLLVGSFFL